MLGAEDADLELADSDEAVVVPLLEVDEADRRALLPGLAVLADAGVLQQQLEKVPVVLQKAAAREAGGELLDDFLDLVVFKPVIEGLLPTEWVIFDSSERF
jgi:hypothetical protein